MLGINLGSFFGIRPNNVTNNNDTVSKPTANDISASSLSGASKTYATNSVDDGIWFPGKELITNAVDAVRDQISDWSGQAFGNLVESAADTLTGLSDEAQGILNKFDTIKDGYTSVKDNVSNMIETLPDFFGIEDTARDFFNTLVSPIDNTIDALDSSLGKQTLELIANEDALSNLLDTVQQASGSFDNKPGQIIKAIAGDMDNLGEALFNPDKHLAEKPYGEYNIIHEPQALMDFLREAFIVPALMNNPEGTVQNDVTDDFFMADPRVVENVMADRLEGQDNHPNEEWFYVNGIALDENLATDNARHLSDMFGRPVDLVYNPTDTVPIDLLECGIDKTKIGDSNAVVKTTETISSALKDPNEDKVVMIGYSQGTIIAGGVLDNLQQMVDNGELTEAELGKLEIYTFANCADQMKSDTVYMEHFANENDFVSRLGILDQDDSGNIVTDTENFSGNVYMREGGWGHILSECYLYDMGNADEQSDWGDMSTSRLFSEYFDPNYNE